MDLNRAWIFLSICFDNIISLATGFNIETAPFIKDSKEPDVRKCAWEVMQNQIFVGGRVSEHKGICEKFTNQNLTTNQEHGNFFKVNFKKIFDPFVDLPVTGTTHFNFQGDPTTESKLEFTFTRTSPTVYWFGIDNGEEIDGTYHMYHALLQVNIYERSSQLDLGGMRNWQSQTILLDDKTFCPTVECKISTTFKDGSVQILANDQLIGTSYKKYSWTTHLRQKTRVTVSSIDTGDVKLKKFQFTKSKVTLCVFK